MPDNRIEAIIFDLGNVLVDFDHRIAAKRISYFTDKNGKEIYDLFFDSEVTGIFEEGKISPKQFFLKVKEMIGLRIEYEEFVPIWNEIFFFNQKNLGVYNLACTLKENYRVALLSNINALHLHYVKKTFPIFGAFHDIITSCDVGFRKPDPQIYQKALETLGVPAQKTFYTDDRKELIESAKLLGINGFTFVGLDQLRRDLVDNGININ